MPDFSCVSWGHYGRFIFITSLWKSIRKSVIAFPLYQRKNGDEALFEQDHIVPLES